jgi:hypothetical protein
LNPAWIINLEAEGTKQKPDREGGRRPIAIEKKEEESKPYSPPPS